MLRAVALAALPLLAPPSAAQELLREGSGTPLSGYGLVAPAGDVDGDGVHDTIVGAPGDAAGSQVAGCARVVSGADGSTLLLLSEGGALGRYGQACASAGDVDGDGHADLIVGAPGIDRAYVHSGADGTVLVVLAGDAPGESFGAAVAGVGDADGDGLDDVAVGAPGNDQAGPDAGKVSVYSGQTGAVVSSATGNAAGDGFGAAISGGPDGGCMADNEGDVIVGATAAGGDRRGYVRAHSRDDFGVLWQVAGGPDDGLGAAVAHVGDLDGDGVPDVAVGSDPRNAQGQPAKPGFVRVLSGGSGALIRSHTDGLLGSGFGHAVRAIGDVNGDGVADLGVGAPGADANGADSGSLRVYSGANGAPWLTLHGPSAGARLGARLAFADDVSGDGVPDVAVGAPGAQSGAGRVYVFSCSRWADMGSGLAGGDGIPRLSGEGGLVSSTEASLTLSGARASTSATLVLGLGLAIDDATGTLVTSAESQVTGLATDAEGGMVYTFPWPDGFPSDTTIYHQVLVSDPAAPGGVARSNAVAATVP